GFGACGRPAFLSKGAARSSFPTCSHSPTQIAPSLLTAAFSTLRSPSGCETKRSDFCDSRRRSHQCALARLRARPRVGSRRSRARSRTSRSFSPSQREGCQGCKSSDVSASLRIPSEGATDAWWGRLIRPRLTPITGVKEGGSELGNDCLLASSTRSSSSGTPKSTAMLYGTAPRIPLSDGSLKTRSGLPIRRAPAQRARSRTRRGTSAAAREHRATSGLDSRTSRSAPTCEIDPRVHSPARMSGVAALFLAVVREVARDQQTSLPSAWRAHACELLERTFVVVPLNARLLTTLTIATVSRSVAAARSTRDFIATSSGCS